MGRQLSPRGQARCGRSPDLMNAHKLGNGKRNTEPPLRELGGLITLDLPRPSPALPAPHRMPRPPPPAPATMSASSTGQGGPNGSDTLSQLNTKTKPAGLFPLARIGIYSKHHLRGVSARCLCSAWTPH